MFLTSSSPFAKQTFTEHVLYTKAGVRPVKGSKKRGRKPLLIYRFTNMFPGKPTFDSFKIQ